MTQQEREYLELQKLAEKQRAVNITLNWIEDYEKEQIYLETIKKLKKELEVMKYERNLLVQICKDFI